MTCSSLSPCQSALRHVLDLEQGAFSGNHIYIYIYIYMSECDSTVQYPDAGYQLTMM